MHMCTKTHDCLCAIYADVSVLSLVYYNFEMTYIIHQVHNFLDKNKDLLHSNVVDLLIQSKNRVRTVVITYMSLYVHTSKKFRFLQPLSVIAEEQ